MKHREDPTDSLNIEEKDLIEIDLETIKPNDWVYSLGTLSIEMAGVLNQLGRFGFCIRKKEIK